MLRDSFEEEPMATATCPKCEIEWHLDPVPATDWVPPDGLDPRLREFDCPRCKEKFYKRVRVKMVKPTERLPGL